MRQILLLCFLLVFLWLPAQMVSPVNKINFPSSSSFVPKTKTKTHKNYGDTLWNEDFAGGLPNGWSIVNNSRAISAFMWQWDTLYRPGQFSQNISAINSTSNSNGFMLLPMDFWNTPISMAVSADTYFQSPAIPITSSPSVELRLQQFYRFCCWNGAKVVAQVSIDNFQTFDEYNLNSLFVNQISSNVEFTSVNVSRTLAYQDTAYLRFYIEGLSHYFWMIDDLALVEGSGQEVFDPMVTPLISATSPPLTVLPFGYAQNFGFNAQVKSVTGDSISNTSLLTEIAHERYSNGTAGLGSVYSQTNLVNGNGALSPLDTALVSTISPWFLPTVTGQYTAQFTTTSRQYPQAFSDSTEFVISDTTFGRDYNEVSSQTAPYFTGRMGNPSNGDALGILYHIDSISSPINFSSISVFVSNSNGVIGAEIRPVIWEYDSLSNFQNSGVGQRVASSLSTTILDSSNVNSWTTFKLDTGIAFRRGSNHGQYIVGWEEISTGPFPTYNALFAGVDLRASKLAPRNTAFSKSGQNANWIPVSVIPMVRLNIQPLTVGVGKKSLIRNDLKVYPNPSNGAFTLENATTIQTLEIYNVNGQKVDAQLVNTQLDLSNEPNGIYLLRLQLKNGEVISKKLVKH